MAFHEVQFPTAIAYRSGGGPTRRTEIIELDSGYEARNTTWAQSRRRYNVAYGVKTYALLHELLAFWEARNGPLHGFRYKDWSDYKSVQPQATVTATDQLIGTGDNSDQTFQLIKTYSSGGFTYARTINKPVTGTVKVALNDVEQGSGWSLDPTTGIITFVTAPGAGVTVKAGYEFDVPVRFEADELTINLEAFNHGTVDPIILNEIRV